jgi:ArsR family transcriptional regulator
VKLDLVEDECCPSILQSPVEEKHAGELATAFAALSDPSRLRLFSMIAAREEVCACELVEPIGKSQPTISHHLRILFEAGLVERERRGTWIWYRAVPTRIEALREALSPKAAARPGKA